MAARRFSSCWTRCQAFQILLAQFSLGGFESAHGPALPLRVGQRLQSVFSLESIQMRIGLAELGVRG